MQIILLRHGEPNMPPQNRVTAKSFYNWVQDYKNSALNISSTPATEAIDCAKNSSSILCSELLRSTESARALKIKEIKYIDSEFNEVGMPSANWGFIKLLPRTWSVIFRILWLFGYSKNSESHNEAKIRASEAARKLSNLAKEHNSILFVGHGIFNQLLADNLRSTGWIGPKNPSLTYWDFGIYKFKET